MTAPEQVPSEQIAIVPDTEYVRAADGERIFVRRWRPAEESTRAAIVLSHGLAEHTGFYLPFAEHFSARGAAVYAHDHRGFGRSGGRRGHVSRYERYVEDLHALVERARAENRGQPLVLVGHSMGGTIALLYTLRYPETLTCAIYSAPALILRRKVSRRTRVLGYAMSRLYPTYTQTGRIDPTLLTRDPAMQQAVLDDPFRHAHVTARLFTEMFVRAPREALARAGELRIPFLIVHGTDDGLVWPLSSRLVHGRAAAAGREIRLYPGLRHEVFREVERDEVFGDVVAWLATQGIVLC